MCFAEEKFYSEIGIRLLLSAQPNNTISIVRVVNIEIEHHVHPIRAILEGVLSNTLPNCVHRNHLFPPLRKPL